MRRAASAGAARQSTRLARAQCKGAERGARVRTCAQKKVLRCFSCGKRNSKMRAPGRAICRGQSTQSVRTRSESDRYARILPRQQALRGHPALLTAWSCDGLVKRAVRVGCRPHASGIARTLPNVHSPGMITMSSSGSPGTGFPVAASRSAQQKWVSSASSCSRATPAAVGSSSKRAALKPRRRLLNGFARSMCRP